LFEVLLKEVVQLPRELDTCGTTADDDGVEEAVDFALGLAGESGTFDAYIKSVSSAITLAR
jgi:hypothetical protein